MVSAAGVTDGRWGQAWAPAAIPATGVTRNVANAPRATCHRNTIFATYVNVAYDRSVIAHG